ncbi:cell division protein FtsQ/DivIB [Latilactobacillus fuchuensis]|uniref:Cell division protein DivIB n=1 Tax=Latilactobacillus fuchuensis DSM 14340 = JCM 11249 TaxID=1423747 RepID=A0A0R1RYK6_9LACO|nr:cell division protein FtsQ/DivIB [Latilactobacillus fuchuensis]KRL61438.1 cell division FtsQ family protein [Latilactobacillus fuchuensis DSM 14340 = JCM 11249]
MKKEQKPGAHDPLQLLNIWRSYQLKRWKKERRKRLKPGRPTISNQLPQFKEQRSAKTKWRLAVLLVVFTVGTVISLYFMSPSSDIQQLAVSGTKSVPDQQVINASQISLGDNVLWQLMHQKETKQRIQTKLPKIKQVNIKVVQYNQINLSVSEYQTVGYLVREKQYYPILENGQILKTKMTQSLGSSPVYSGFKNDTYLKQGLKLYRDFPKSIQSAVSEIRLTAGNNNPYQIHLYMNDGNEVIGDLRTLATKIKYYPVLVKQMKGKGQLDLEVGAYSKSFETSK